MNNRYFSEGVGTFALVFCGCGAIVVDTLFGQALGHVGVSLVFGLIVMAVIYAIGNISGAHINPAVTVGFAFAGRLPWRQVTPYVASQLFGAVLAGGLLALLFPSTDQLGATLPSGHWAQALALETVITFLLMFVILNVSTGHKEKGIMAGVAVGGMVALMALFAGPVTGASMNPARSLGPALWSGAWQEQWLYLVGPVAGAMLAYPSCRWVQGPECCDTHASKEALDGV